MESHSKINLMKPLQLPLSSIFFRGFFVGILLIGLLSALHPAIRSYLTGLMHKQFRHVLSSATGPLFTNGHTFKVIKLETHEGIFLEVYGQNAEGARPLLDRLQLRDRRDAFLTYKDKTSNLFIDDVDEDQSFEIIAPTFDENLVPHMNIFQFNPANQKIEVKNISISSPQ